MSPICQSVQQVVGVAFPTSNHEDIFVKCLYKADPQKFRYTKISRHVIIIFRKVYTYVWKPGSLGTRLVMLLFFSLSPTWWIKKHSLEIAVHQSFLSAACAMEETIKLSNVPVSNVKCSDKDNFKLTDINFTCYCVQQWMHFTLCISAKKKTNQKEPEKKDKSRNTKETTGD